jgi:ribonuclease D
MSDTPVEVVWLDSSQAFAEIAASWLNSDCLAIDTEFERRTTYYPILALVQVYDGKKVYLIDPLAVECPPVFRQICADPSIIKIMHSAREDLEVFYYSWQCKINGLFDSQIAYSFLNEALSIGYAPLVEKLCAISLDKEQTQSDWIKRPLSAKQHDYAANDVLYLIKIYQDLAEQIKSKPFYDLFKQECQELTQVAIKPTDLTSDYRDAKDVWKLKPTDLALFHQLYNWRERTAIDHDRTRNHILRDPELVQVAIVKPKSKTALSKVDNFHPRSFRLYWQAITELVNQYTDPDDLPSAIANPRDIKNLNLLTDRLLSQVKQVAKQKQLMPSLLMSKRIARKIAFAHLTGEKLPPGFSGWRANLLKPVFDSILTEFKPD